MNRHIYLAMVVGALVGCNTVPARSTKIMPAGHTLKAAYFGATNPDCTPLDYPVVRITGRPAHGTTELKHGTDYPLFNASNPRSACNSKPVPSVQVMYSPDPGFVGSDTVGVQVIFPEGREENHSIAIEVK